jgi:hypothetical protein
LTYSQHWVLTGDTNFPTPWGFHAFSDNLIFLIQNGISTWKIGTFVTASATTSVIGELASSCTNAGAAVGPAGQHGFYYSNSYFYLSYSGFGLGTTNVLKVGPLLCPSNPTIPWENL